MSEEKKSKKQDNRICIVCKEEGITKRASFNLPESKKPEYCKPHSKENMINFNAKSNMCTVCEKTQKSYGIIGKPISHCSKCATEDMVDLVSNLCKFENCRKNATYGIIGQKADRCKKHAEKDMIDVKNKKCIVCIALKVKNPKQPTFGIEKLTHCLEHKEEKMTDLRHDTERCKTCNIRATYGLKDGRPEYCTEHKLENMIDLVSKMCSKCGQTQAVFGESKTELFCKGCSTPEMKNVIAKMCEKCGEHQPSFNYPKEKIPRFCSNCKLDGMEDIKNPKCISCKLFMVNKKPHLCAYCKPESTLKQKTHEMQVVNYLEENNIKFVHNKSVGFVCGNYRPDVKIDAGTHLVIVEIDEDQHSQYDSSCELARMLNIHQAEGLKCIFLRYNPDVVRYNDKVVKIQQNTRLKTLLQEINKSIENVPRDEVTVYRLYYNNDKGEHVQKCDINSDCIKLVQSFYKLKI